MKKKDRKALGKYMREIADLMELRDWHLDLSHEVPDDEEVWATCLPTEGRRHATLRFALDFRDLDTEQQRMIVVHELVHCHLAVAQAAAEKDLFCALGGPASSLFQASFRRSLEFGVDGLAHALAKHMPMIEWPK